MLNSRKIGIGVITYNRPDFYRKVIESLPKNTSHHSVVVNDGVNRYALTSDADTVIFNDSQLGVSKTKNRAIRCLIEHRCTDLFLFEDDVFVKNPDVFQQYIDVSDISNIPHLCFGPVEITKMYQTNLKLTCMYSTTLGVDLYHNPQGGLMYFNLNLIDEEDCVFDEQYQNAFEHIDVAYNLIGKNVMPPFWYFPDIYNSIDYLESIPTSSALSTITHKDQYNQNVNNSAEYFIKKWGKFTNQIPDVSKDFVIQTLKAIKNR